ncbi:hypothetical protein HGM15179_019296 [Zosterops borbonicus]|uniref:Uncharacterized protein n=1 Tax=Zosterops borbonicus TaxID=364589 RepID=A0A8K1FW20_9PASS|nr:hypothetical protein HGM15179_019296 [Zosterops borbonicus]
MYERPRGSQCPELEVYDCENDQLPAEPELVQDILGQLDPYKSMGLMGFSQESSEMVDVIAKPVSMIFEQTWESGKVRAVLKLANIVPIFKKGKKDPGNYRPVSLTSVPSKIMEKDYSGRC